MSFVKRKYEDYEAYEHLKEVEMRTKELETVHVATYDLEHFNNNAERNGFPKRKVCRGKSSNSPRPGICPKTVVSYLPREGICSIKEHGLPVVNYRLPLDHKTSACPWISVKAVFQSILMVSANVHCLQFRDGVKQVGLLIDSQTKDTVGVMDLDFGGEEKRIVVAQIVVSSNQEYIGVICQLNYNQRMRVYKIYVVGSSDVENRTDSRSHTMNSLDKVRMYNRLRHAHNNAATITEHSFRMAFVPGFTTSHYMLLNIRNGELVNGRDVRVVKVSLEEKAFDRSLVETRDLGFGCRSRVMNLAFAQDGALVVVCFQHVVRTDDCEHFGHVVLSTSTLQVLQRLRHVLTIDFFRSVNPLACFLNATPSVRYDGRELAIIYSSHAYCKVVTQEDPCDGSLRLECLPLKQHTEKTRNVGDAYPPLMVNVYSLPLMLLSLRSLAKLTIKMFVGNDPLIIRQLPIAPVLQEYIYDC